MTEMQDLRDALNTPEDLALQLLRRLADELLAPDLASLLRFEDLEEKAGLLVELATVSLRAVAYDTLMGDHDDDDDDDDDNDNDNDNEHEIRK